MSTPSSSDLHASDKIFTFSNIISFVRVFLTIPTVWALLEGKTVVAASLMALAYITDIADGYVARKTNTISEFGKAIDPIADKIFVAGIGIVMVLKGLVPFWFIAFVIGKDLVTLIGSLLVRNKIKAVLPSNYWGKSAVLMTIVCLFLAVCGLSADVLVFGWLLSTALLCVSFVIYVRRAIQMISAPNADNGILR